MVTRTDAFHGIKRIFSTSTIDAATRNEAQNVFDAYRKRNVIQTDSMEKDIWTLSDEKHCVHLSFVLDPATYTTKAKEWLGCTFQEFIVALKIFILLLMGTYTLNGLAEKLKICRELGTVDAESIHVSSVYSHCVLDFLSILPGVSTTRDRVMDALDVTCQFPVFRARTLADFNTYVTFEERLNTLWKRSQLPDKIHLFPVYLWWSLTSILPLRPTEFLLTPRQCLRPISSPKDGRGRQEILVRRTRLKKGMRIVRYSIQEDYDIFAYGIPDFLSQEIEWYLQTTRQTRQSSLDTLFVPGGRSAYLNYAAMVRLLQQTLIQLEMNPLCIHLGDTRHLSMISLILAGDTPSICKALANHESVSMSAGYYTNMATLSDCQTLRFLVTQVHPASLNPPLEAKMPAHGMLALHDGRCNWYTAESFDAMECSKIWDPVLGIGSCHVCPHFVPNDDAVFVQMRDDSLDRASMNAELLMDAIEQLRKGKGKMETIDMLVKRLRHEVTLYLDFSQFVHAEQNQLPNRKDA